jgi:hypothetical protein
MKVKWKILRKSVMQSEVPTNESGQFQIRSVGNLSVISNSIQSQVSNSSVLIVLVEKGYVCTMKLESEWGESCRDSLLSTNPTFLLKK